MQGQHMTHGRRWHHVTPAMRQCVRVCVYVCVYTQYYRLALEATAQQLGPDDPEQVAYIANLAGVLQVSAYKHTPSTHCVNMYALLPCKHAQPGQTHRLRALRQRVPLSPVPPCANVPCERRT